MIRSTLIVDGPLALRMQRLAAAREGAVGREILTLPLLAARLAGGFTAPAGADVLYPAIQKALAAGSFRDLQQVSLLPGMPRAVLQSLDASTANSALPFGSHLSGPFRNKPAQKMSRNSGWGGRLGFR
jgi:hypothetical protein